MRICIVFILSAVLVGSAQAQRKKGHCTGSTPDSLWLAQGPVYRDCEVDQKAKLLDVEPRVDFTPRMPPASARGACYRVDFEFVVDTLGQPELPTVRTRRSNNRDYEDAVRASLPQLKYTPARLGDRPVRQLVVYKLGYAIVPFSVPAGSTPTPPDNLRPPPGCQ